MLSICIGVILRINSVIQDDAGEYGCRATNAAGSLDAAVNLRVIPGTPPTFIHDAADIKAG